MDISASAFISGALSAAKGKVRFEIFYERIGDLCKKMGIDAFVPHRDASHKTMPNYTHRKLYTLNMKKIKEVDLLIAYVGEPSTGVGMEIQQATINGKDVLILCEEDRPKSRLLLGCPSVVEYVEFKSFDDALEKIEKVLADWLENRKKTLVKP